MSYAEAPCPHASHDPHTWTRLPALPAATSRGTVSQTQCRSARDFLEARAWPIPTKRVVSPRYGTHGLSPFGFAWSPRRYVLQALSEKVPEQSHSFGSCPFRQGSSPLRLSCQPL